MSVMIDTSLGEVVVDLFCDEAPLAAKNFLKLCKMKYYNGCLFYNVQQNFMIQTGDPTATGKGGTSVYGLMYGEQARFFEDEISATSRKHDEAGLLSMANMGVPNSNGSQFFFSMRGDDMQHLDGKHTVFAKVMEGMEALEQINSQFCDDNGRPYRDIRILHTYVLDDPFDDPPQLVVPDESPSRDRPDEERVALRLGALDKVSLEADEKTELEREKQLREKTARSNAVVLEMIGDLPDADMKPPENVLFVCKLNPVTTDDDLEIIFTRFGTCRAEICRDHVTGDSLNYAFVEFEAIESCEEAFKKMNNVLIDDRRIRVDFSQSVAKEWSKYKGRAQGGQKLASGKGGKPTQHQLQTTKHADNNNANRNVSTADGQPRKSKWGNAPGGGALQGRRAVPSDASWKGDKRLGDDDDAVRNGSGWRTGGESDAAPSRWSGGGGNRRREDGGRHHHHRRGDDGRHAGDEAGEKDAAESRQSRGGGGGHPETERRGQREGGKRRHDDRDGRSRGSRDKSSDGRRWEDERNRGGRGGGDGRSETGVDDRHHRHRSVRREGDDDAEADTDAGRHASGRRREEREGGGRRRRGDGDRGDERSRRKDRSRSRSRERSRARSGSRDRGRTR